jgi:hypothetical protein
VLEALVTWTATEAYPLSTWAGLTTFLEIARDSYVPARPGDNKWPTLLWLLKEDVECRRKIIILWRRALANQLTERHALRVVLRRWLGVVDKDERLYDTFERLLGSLIKGDDPYAYERIESWLEDRNDDSRDRGATTQKLLLMLTH